jgi:hypothetical protein
MLYFAQINNNKQTNPPSQIKQTQSWSKAFPDDHFILIDLRSDFTRTIDITALGNTSSALGTLFLKAKQFLAHR